MLTAVPWTRKVHSAYFSAALTDAISAFCHLTENPDHHKLTDIGSHQAGNHARWPKGQEASHAHMHNHPGAEQERAG